MGLRRRSREKTLQILYCLEFNDRVTVDEAIDQYYEYFNLHSAKSNQVDDDDEKKFVSYLVHQVIKNMDFIQNLIENAATNWRIDRIALVERNILRFAIAELTDETNSIPFKATINEAIDIAKKFGNKESPAFINGIINKVADIVDVKRRKA